MEAKQIYHRPEPIYLFRTTSEELMYITIDLRRLHRDCVNSNELPKDGLCESIYFYTDRTVAALFSLTFSPDCYDIVLGSRLYWGHGGYEGSINYAFTPMREAVLLLFIESLPDLVIIKN